MWLNTKEGMLHQRQKVCNVGRGKGGRNKSLDQERAPRAGGWRMHWKIHSRFLFAYVMCALIRNLELSFLVVNSQKRAGTGFWANEIYRRRTYSWPFFDSFQNWQLKTPFFFKKRASSWVLKKLRVLLHGYESFVNFASQNGKMFLSICWYFVPTVLKRGEAQTEFDSSSAVPSSKPP